MIRNYQDLTTKEMAAADKERTVVLIPLGAIEQHGPQAPLGTDYMIAQAMPVYIRKELEAVDPDYPMLIFPAIPVGLSVEHMNFSGTITMKPDHYYNMLYDIAQSLAEHGFRKLAFLICHGGNRACVDILSRQLRHDFGIYAFVLASGAFSDPEVLSTISEGNTWDFHGGEMETSMVMALHPETVHLEESRTGYKKGGYKKKGAVNFSNATALPWMAEDLETEDGTPVGIGGNPEGATAEKGEIILTRSAKALVPALLEIRDWKMQK